MPTVRGGSDRPGSRAAVTLRDVARKAGVHPSTVSRALNIRTRTLVNMETVKRVVEASEQLGYQPNSLARGLKMNRTFTVGALIPDLTNPLFPPIVRGIEERLRGTGYTVILGNTDNDNERERSIVEVMRNRRVDGLILATASRHFPILQELLADGMPVVLINRTTDDSLVPAVTGDDHAGVGLAVQHLASLGHTEIAHVAGPQSLTTGLVRYRGFRSWMRREGLTVDPDRIVFAEWFQEGPGALAFRELLDREKPFTAVVAGNDLIALGCYEVLREVGLRVPGDVSIIGYNDIPFSDQFDPPLTTIRIPHYEIGAKAAECLLSEIEGDRTTGKVLRLPPSLVDRASTAAPSR
jgi:LacI family transcriptional regulator